MKAETKARKLAAMADWSFYGTATIEMFPRPIQSAFRRFERHQAECSADGTSDAYAKALRDIENRMATWLGSPCSIAWDSDPSCSDGLFAAMTHAVHQFIEKNGK